MDKIQQIKSIKKFLTIGILVVLMTYSVNASMMPVFSAAAKPEGIEKQRCEAQFGKIWLSGKCIELPKPDSECKGIKVGKNTCISGEIVNGGKGGIGTITITFSHEKGEEKTSSIGGVIDQSQLSSSDVELVRDILTENTDVTSYIVFADGVPTRS